MWNDGKYVLFRHIADLFYRDQEFALHALPKLTLDHIVLTPYSKMKVKLAVQVLSKSVAIALRWVHRVFSPGVTFFVYSPGFLKFCDVRAKKYLKIKPKFLLSPSVNFLKLCTFLNVGTENKINTKFLYTDL